MKASVFYYLIVGESRWLSSDLTVANSNKFAQRHFPFSSVTKILPLVDVFIKSSFGPRSLF